MSRIKGLADGDYPGWVLQSYQVAMPKGMDNILAAIRECLSEKQVQSLTLKMGEPITYTRLVPEREAKQQNRDDEESRMTFGDVARNVPMEEAQKHAALGEEKSMIVDLFLAFELRRLFVSHIGISPESVFFKWLQADPLLYGGIEYFLGAKVVKEKDIPDDVLILFGSTTWGGRASDISFAMKCHLYVPEEDDERQESPG